MASSSKRRSTRQPAGRKRSIYAEPESEDDLMDMNDASDGEDDYTPVVDAADLSQPRSSRKKRRVDYRSDGDHVQPPQLEPTRRQRRKVARRSKPQTRGREKRMPKVGRRPGPKKRKYGFSKAMAVAGKEPQSRVFAAPSDGVIPPWTTLPLEILRDVFIFASQPLHEYTTTASANAAWLVRAARSCRAFAIPALEAFYQSPALLNQMAPHRLLELLQTSKEKLYMDYKVKVKSLQIDVRPLTYSAHNRGLFDLGALVQELQQLQHLEVIHPVDSPPFRPMKIQPWRYPHHLLSRMEAGGTRLRSWRWNRDMFSVSDGLPNCYGWMTLLHTSKSFEYLNQLVVCNFNVNNSPEPPQPADETLPRQPSLATAIAKLPALKDLTFISCDAVVDDFLERIPRNLERLEITNCLEVTSTMLSSYLATGGLHLRELILDHNPSLNLSFLLNLQAFCPRLEVLKMDFTYYSERHNYNDAWAIYDHLLTVDEVPTWPDTLRHLELLHLQKLDAEAAQNLFRSLVEGAKNLPNLRDLVLQAHINIPWRDRVEFRDQWIERLRRVYLRKEPAPHAEWGSLKQFRLWKAAQSNGKKPTATVDLGSDNEAPLHRRFSHVRVTPRKPLLDADIDAYSDEEPSPVKSRLPPRRSTRVAESQSAASEVAIAADDSSEYDSEPDENSDDWRKRPEAFIQGLCKIVDIRIDNQRPRENQYTEANFLDSEPSGDEDWHSGAELSDDGYAW